MLLGRIFRRSHFETGIKLFSGNTSLLETFSQVTGGVSSREANTAASGPEAKSSRLPNYSKSLLTAEPAAEFNDTRGFQSFNEPHRFRGGETYKSLDLSASRYHDFGETTQSQNVELRPSVDIFKRHKCSALFTHKTGKILHRKVTGHSAKTQRQLGKAIRRARQMAEIHKTDNGVFNSVRTGGGLWYRMAFPYEAPDWSCLPGQKFKIEVIKSGTVISEELLPMDREFFSIGRLPTCDISMEHGSVSRHHAVLQFGQEGIFIYDLGSTHGTFLNKQRIASKIHIRLPSDSILRFGESTRHYVISSLTEDEPIKYPWKDEPLNFLRRFLKEQDEQIDIVVEAEEAGGFRANITLDSSIFTDSSETLCGSGTGGSKKEASDKAAADICQQIDKLGGFALEGFSLSLGRRRSLSPPEDDSYFDRTAKRVTRDSVTDKTETVDSLYTKQANLKNSIAAIIKQIAETEKALSPIEGGDSEIDELDAVMNELNSKQAAKDLKHLSSQLVNLKAELESLDAVLKVVDPTGEHLPPTPIATKTKQEVSQAIHQKQPTVDAEEQVEEHTEDFKEEEVNVQVDQQSEEHLDVPEVSEEEGSEWVPPEETESERTRLFKEKYGY